MCFDQGEVLWRVMVCGQEKGGFLVLCRVLTGCRAPQNGKTPLMWAICNGFLQVVHELLACGADVEAKDEVRGGLPWLIGCVCRGRWRGGWV